MTSPSLYSARLKFSGAPPLLLCILPCNAYGQLVCLYLKLTASDTFILQYIYIYTHTHTHAHAHWRSGEGTTLQTGTSRVRFPMVSLEFFSDILPVALCPWGRLIL